MLDAIPDLSETLTTASPQQLTEIFKAFDVTITYATITPELLPQNDDDRSGERSRMFGVAGAGAEHLSATGIRAWAVWDLAGKRWLSEGFW